MRRLFQELSTKLPPAASSLGLAKHTSRLACPVPLTHHYQPFIAPQECPSARYFSISSWLSRSQSSSSGSGSKRGSDTSSRRPKKGSISRDKIKMSSDSNDNLSSSQRKTRSTRSNRSTTSSGHNSVKHDKSHHRFTLELEDNQLAHIDYRTLSPASKSGGKNCKVFELYHSEVPKELRGKGIGKALARGTFEHLASRQQHNNDDVKIKLTCSYLIDYMNKHADPKFKKLLAKDD